MWPPMKCNFQCLVYFRRDCRKLEKLWLDKRNKMRCRQGVVINNISNKFGRFDTKQRKQSKNVSLSTIIGAPLISICFPYISKFTVSPNRLHYYCDKTRKQSSKRVYFIICIYFFQGEVGEYLIVRETITAHNGATLP